MPTFSPGPWSFRRNRATGHDLIQADATPIAEVFTRGDLAQANVRLIAAAPELYQAAYAAFHALSSYAYGNGSPDLAETVAEALKEAIDKANGTLIREGSNGTR